MHRLLSLALFGLALCAAMNAHADDAPERGRALYRENCSACHAPDFNGAGPAHRGVVGRLAGTVPGFTYSPALKDAGFVWTPERLDRWLTDPEAVRPGQRMGVSVADAAERADLIAYLRTLGEAPQKETAPRE